MFHGHADADLCLASVFVYLKPVEQFIYFQF